MIRRNKTQCINKRKKKKGTRKILRKKIRKKNKKGGSMFIQSENSFSFYQATMPIFEKYFNKTKQELSKDNINMTKPIEIKKYKLKDRNKKQYWIDLINDLINERKLPSQTQNLQTFDDNDFLHPTIRMRLMKLMRQKNIKTNLNTDFNTDFEETITIIPSVLSFEPPAPNDEEKIFYLIDNRIKIIVGFICGKDEIEYFDIKLVFIAPSYQGIGLCNFMMNQFIIYTKKNKYTLMQAGEKKEDGTIPAFKCYIKVFKNKNFHCMSNNSNSTDCTDESVNLTFTK